MKAVITTKYGSPEVLEVREIERPIIKPNEYLVKIKATSVTAAHCAMREGKPLFGRLMLGLTKPKTKISGTDLSGEVIEVGSQVTAYRVGDSVMAATDIRCGAYAEYRAMTDKDPSTKKPTEVTHIRASAIMEGALTALPFVRDHGNLKAGDSILINGASGSIGTAAVQLAKLMGAKVTAVCSAANFDLVTSLGADKVIDYTKTDFTTLDEKYNIIFDTVGKLNFSNCKDSLLDGGKFLSLILELRLFRQMFLTKLTGTKKVIFAATGLRKKEEIEKDLHYIAKLLEEGKIKAIIDKSYSIDQIREAHKHVDTGHKKGNIVIEF